MAEWIGELFFIGALLLAILLVCIYAVVTGKTGKLAVSFSMLFTSRKEFEEELRRCSRGPKFLPARRPGDLNETFGAILGGDFAEYGPRLVSSDPWVVYFDRFLSQAEVKQYEDTLFETELVRGKVSVDENAFSKLFLKLPLVSRMRRRHSARNSLIRKCDARCRSAPVVKAVEERASRICRVPLENFEAVQPFTYKEGMFYKPHTDNGLHDNLLPYGSRIFTVIVYLSDAEVGGGTRFNSLNKTVPARKGAAVLFVNTLDTDPAMTDKRTLHEGLMVLAGEKRGVNLWLRQYNYQEFQAAKCADPGFAHRLAWHGKAAVSEVDNDELRRPPRQPQVKFGNGLSSAVRLFWLDADSKRETLLATLEPEQRYSLNSYVGHEFRLRSGEDGRLLESYVVGEALDGQEVLVGHARAEL